MSDLFSSSGVNLESITGSAAIWTDTWLISLLHPLTHGDINSVGGESTQEASLETREALLLSELNDALTSGLNSTGQPFSETHPLSSSYVSVVSSLQRSVSPVGVDPLTGQSTDLQDFLAAAQALAGEPLPDLVTTLTSVSLKETLIPGAKGKLKITLANRGGIPLQDQVLLTAYAAPLDHPDAAIEIGQTRLQNLTLQKNGSREFSLQVTLPKEIATGNYQIFVVANAQHGQWDANPLNNIAVAASPRQVVWQFGNIPGYGYNVPLRVPDSRGHDTLFTLKGPGYGEIIGGSEFSEIRLYGTDASTDFSINGKANTRVGQIRVDGSLRRLRATSVDLYGGLSVSGSLREIKMDDWVGPQTVEIGQDATIGSVGRIELDEVNDVTLVSQTALGFVKSDSWSDTDGQTDAIVAPSLHYLRVRGDSDADVTVTGHLGEAEVYGDVTGTWQAGSADTLRLGDDAVDWSLDVAGDLNKLDIKGDLSGTIAAEAMTRIQINGDVTNSAILAGADLGADGRLGGGDDTFEAGDLTRIGVNGTVSQSVIAAGLDPVDDEPLNGNERLIADSTLGRVDIRQLSDESRIAATDFGAHQTVNGRHVLPAEDVRYLTPEKVHTDDAAPSLTLALQADTGHDATDGITQTPTLVGTVSDDSDLARVTASFGENSLNITDKVQPDGQFILDEAFLETLVGRTLVDGTYEIAVTAEDTFGNVAEPVRLSMTLDRTAADVVLLSPLVNGTHSANVHLLGNTSEAGTLSTTLDNGTAVEVNVTDTLDQVLQAVPLEDGAHQLTVRFSDVAGNITEQIIDFDVDGRAFVIGATDTTGWGATTENEILLAEGTSFVTQAQVPVSLGQDEGSRTLRFAVDAHFDTTDKTATSGDTLAVYLVSTIDANQTLLDQGTPGTPVFSLTGDTADFTPGLVTYDGRFVEIDLTSLDTATDGTLVFQLLNQDSDTGSRIHISQLTNTVDPEGTEALRFEDSDTVVPLGSELALETLSASSSIEPVFSQIRFNAETGAYTAQVQLRNTGDTSISRQAAVVFEALPEGVSLDTVSGIDSDGNPYVNFYHAIRPGGLAAGELSDAVEMTVSNLEQLQLVLNPQVFVGGPNQAPVFDPIDPIEVMPGQRIKIPLNAVDPDGDRVTYSLRTDTELPNGVLDGTGTLTFMPSPDQLGTYTFTITATDGAETVSQAVTLTVVPDPDTTTRITGQVLDTNSNPLVNTPITFGAAATVTDENGYFTLTVVDDADTLKVFGNQYDSPTGDTFPFVPEKLPLVLGHELYDGVNNVIDRPIYLPALDLVNSEQTTDAVGNITVTNDTLGAEVFVAADSVTDPAGNPFTGAMSISEVPTDLTPAALPEGISPDLVVTIQPGEMTLATPAPLTLPNQAGWPVGMEMELWSINPTTGDFDVVGTGVVSEDGNSVETIEGGIRNSSWHFFVPPFGPGALGGLGDNDPRNPDHRCGATEEEAPFTSNVNLASGGIIETHDLVSYQSLGTSRGVTLTYDSLRADPSPIVHFNVDIPFSTPPSSAEPRATLFRVISKLAFKQGEFEYEVPGYDGDQYGLEGGEHFWNLPSRGRGGISAKPAIQADLKDLASGVYEYALQAGVYALRDGQFSGRSTTINNTIVHVNGTQSQMGNGWGIAGVQELIENADGSVLIIDGNGSEIVFEHEGGYVAPPGNFSTLQKLDDGTFQRITKEQTVYAFDSNNRLASITDRNGNQTQHIYNAAGQLTEIIDPVGLSTQFEYANGRISKIIDPAERETILEYDVSGNLTRITDPDSTSRQFTYDDKGHMVGETDKRGYQEKAVYDFAGRATQAIGKDGRVIKVKPPQVEGLYRPEETSEDPRLAPSLPDAPDDSQVTYSDGRGHVKTTNLDAAGQAVSVRDQVGTQYTVQRNSANLVEQLSTGRDKSTSFEYDDRGNLIRLVDELSDSGYSASNIVTIGNPGTGNTNLQLFDNPGYFPVVAPQKVISKDLNNDGYLDLVSVNALPTYGYGPESSHVSVFFGDAQGRFSGSNVVLFEDQLDVGAAIAVDDFDGDGNQDIVTNDSGSGGGYFAIAFGNGDGTFTEGQSIIEGNRHPYDQRGESIIIHDLDNDGFNDILYNTDDEPAIIFGNPDGILTEPVYLETQNESNYVGHMALADVNGDGQIDIVRQAGIAAIAVDDNFNEDGSQDIINDNDNNNDSGSDGSGLGIAFRDVEGIEVFLNQGARNFSIPITHNKINTAGTPDETNAFVITDLDADGLDDIVSTQYGNTSVTVLFGDTDNPFSRIENYAVNQQPHQVKIADLNGDNQLDIVTANGETDTVSILLNTDTGFTEATDYAIGNYGAAFRSNNAISAAPDSLQLQDINNDGHVDILTANEADNSLSVLLNRGDDSFIESVNYAVGEQPTTLTLDDFNQDGFTDIAVANSNASNGFISILLNQRNGDFEPTLPIPDKVPQSLETPGREKHLVADFNNDGLDDLLSVDYSNSIFIQINNGDATFATPIEFEMGDTVQSVTPGDLNQDGTLDILVSTYDVRTRRSRIIPIASDDNRALVIGTPWYLDRQALNISTGDFNGDGILDFSYLSQDGNSDSNLVIWLGDGTGTFQQSSSTVVSLNSPYDYESADESITQISDINNDGLDDLVYLREGRLDSDTDEVFLSALLSNGDGSFTESFAQHISPDSTEDSLLRTSRLGLADLNGDGNLDIALTYEDEQYRNRRYYDERYYLQTFLGDGNGAFSEQHTQNITRFEGSDDEPDLGIVDINGDQYADLLLIAEGDSHSVLSVLLGDESGHSNFQDSQRYQEYAVFASTGTLLTGHFNLDSDSDVLLNQYDKNYILLNQLSLTSDDAEEESGVTSTIINRRNLVNAKLFTYDDTFSQLTSVTDELGSTTLFTVDGANGNTLEMRQVLGEEGGSDDIVTTYTYTDAGLVDLETDDLGRVKDYDYDRFGRLVQLTLAQGTEDEATQLFGYDAAGNLTQFTDENGQVTTYEYDVMNRLIRQVDADPDGTGVQQAPVTLFGYDAAGNLIETTDANGNTTAFAYDPLNRLTQRVDADDQATDYGYDQAGNVVSMTNVRGETTTYRYDTRNRLISETDAAGSTSYYQYDADNNLTAIEDAEGNRTNYFYDARQRLTSIRDANGRFTDYDYDAVDNLVAVRDRNGAITRYSYDHLNRLTEIEDAEGNQVQTTYSEVGNIARSIDQRGNETTYSYDHRNRLVLTTDALDGEIRYDYDGVGNVLSTIDQLGRETTYSYDGLNRLTQVTDPLNHSTGYGYDSVGNLTQVTGELGRVVNYSYDSLNRNTQVTDADGHTTRTHYDEVGNVVAVTDELGRTTRYDYDGRNWLIRTTDALGHRTTYDYDAVGNITAVTDALGQQTRYEYDDLYRQTKTIDALGKATTTTYDNEGNILSLTDASGNVTTYAYDDIYQLATESITVDGSVLTRAYDYDAAGNLIERIDRNGRAQTFEYDALNRLDTEQWLDDERNPIRTISYGYDAASQLQSLSDPDAVYTYDYDLAGRLIQVDNNNTPGVPRVVFDYSYDAANNITQISDSIEGVQAGVERFAYDRLNRVTQITQSGSGVADKRVDMAYDAASQMMGLTRYSDLAGAQLVAETDYAYDAAGRITGLIHQRGDETLAGYEFDYDAANRLTRLVTPDGTSEYGYNRRDELVSSDHSYQDNEAYDYDATGNRTNHVTGDHNRILEDGTYSYEYDNEGNRTRRVAIETGDITDYTWDHRNRLTAVVTTDSDGAVLTEAVYTYDAYDRRIAKVVDADGEGAEAPTEERFVYDGDHIALVFDGQGNQTHRYLHGSQVDQVLAEETADGETRWALTDHQGTVRDVVDNDGNVLNHITYDSFGQVTSESNPDIDFRFGYTGREVDDETGLMYYRARYFDPAVGTFVSTDPLGFDAGDSNIYRYVFNSPTNYTDPSGLLTIYNGNPIRDALNFYDTVHYPYSPNRGPASRAFDAFAPEPLRNFDLNLSINAGEGYGERAQRYWAERYVDEDRNWLDRSFSFGMGVLSSLWTCETSDATAATLTTAWGLAKPAASTTIDDLWQGARNLWGRGHTPDPIQPLGGRGPRPIDPSDPMSQFGSHTGDASGRPFYPSETGLPISARQLSTDGVRVTRKGVEKVGKHLERFGPDSQNQAQLQRLQDIASGKLKPTSSDLNNYTHELRESLRYKKLGYETGVPDDPDVAARLWNNSHTATLEEYGLKEGYGVLYHPSTY